MAAAKAEAGALCPPDPWTEKRYDCLNGVYLQTCTRRCSYRGNCSVACGAWSCACIAGDEWHC